MRNSLRPINRLHPEVIALCATFISDADPKPIVPLTHVCRYWRRAITSSPRNWASIGSGWKGLVPLCLERAGAVPLTVDINVSHIKRNEVFHQALLPHIHRITHLSLKGYSLIEDVANDPAGLFASPMPNLTSLELEQTKEPAESLPSDELPVPPLLQDTSKLKSLHLTQTPLYPPVFSITSLVELKLVGYTTPLRFEKLIEFLHSNPDLELVVLDLQFAEGLVQTSPERKVSLLQLRLLEFTCGNAKDARRLLSCVSLRRGIHIAIQGSQSNPCGDLASFLPNPPTHIQQLLTPVTAIKYWNAPKWRHVVGGNGRLSFRSHKSPSKMYDEFKLFVTEAVREFHLNVERLDPGSGRLSWPLGRLPALEVLAFFEAQISPGSLSILAKEQVLCPSLKTIAFFDCEITGDVIRELGEVLAKRRDSAAARLYQVVIVNNTRALPDLQLIHQLRKFVPRVDVGVGEELPDLL